jgi:hypothetical protein
MGISLDMLRKLYDDKGKDALAGWKSTLQKFGAQFNFSDLPQISTSFVGYEEFNRQTISLKLDAERPSNQIEVQAGDPDMSKMKVSRVHISRSIGRKANDVDVELWVSRRQGARSTGQLDGDLFAYSTWAEHTYQSTRERGLVCSRDDRVFKKYMQMEHMLLARALELACEKGDKEFGRQYNVDFDYVKLERAEPGTYEAMALSEDRTDVQSNKKVARLNRPEINYGGGAEDAMGCDIDYTDLFGDEDEKERQAARKRAELGESSSAGMDVDGEEAYGGTLHIGPRPQ